MAGQTPSEFLRRYELLGEVDRDIFHCVTKGMTNLQIVAELHLGLLEVKGYRQRVINFLGAKDALEMMRLAREAGLTRAR